MSRGCMYGLFVVAWLCCSSLHIGARNPNPQNLITNPEEGDFLIYDLQASIACMDDLLLYAGFLKFYS
jgi:hypothetical protein